MPPPVAGDEPTADDEDGGVAEAAVCSGPRLALATGTMEDTCVVELPPESGGMLDPAQVVLEMGYPGMQPWALTDVQGADGCSQIPGGFFFEPPSLPTTVVLCAQSCEQLPAGAALSLVLGCQP